jgi:Protein of unknown function (DUF2851)
MTVREEFMSYVWRYQRLAGGAYKTTDGQILKIIKTGVINVNAGPDFDQARIILDDIEWVGSVELHVKASDWNLHKHPTDYAYDKVILHVVWENDKTISRPDGSQIPTFELKNNIEKDFVRRFDAIIKSNSEIKCEAQISNVTALAKSSMLEKALAHRLEAKAQAFLPILKYLKNDFEEFSYRIFCRHMGFKLNSDAFNKLAENLPFSIIRKHKSDLKQLEALLFGQAGFLENPQDEYAIELKVEYDFLKQKYNLENGLMSRSEWQFLRTRPGNFPTVRLAQMAAILHSISGVFDAFVLNLEVKNIASFLRIKPSEYWLSHYDFGKKSSNLMAGMGKSSVDVLILNCASVLLNIYSSETDNPVYFQKAINLLEELKPEVNVITSKWQGLGIKACDAFESQALIEQYNGFCAKNRCLACPIGHELLKN